MANFRLFGTRRTPPPADTRNEAGGRAYARRPKDALALYAATGCLNDVYYADAQAQLEQALALCAQVPAAFVAKTAIYARRRGHMKDMPALLVAWLAQHDGERCARVFDRVIDNGRMLRNVVQILRSGVVGRKSLGSRPKRLVRQWLERASVDELLNAAIGQRPSLADIVRMVHPKPQDSEREALYAWLIGTPCAPDRLPAVVQQFEAFKRGDVVGTVPEVHFQYLTASLGRSEWKTVARRLSWQSLRMNLNTLQRNGVFEDAALTARLAATLRDEAQIRKARAMPYQLLAAWNAGRADLPPAIRDALQDAMEIATDNVPHLQGNVVVAIDVSGSMASPVTGHRHGATTAVRCVDVAALVAACVQRKNPSARVLPFDTVVRAHVSNPRDSVITQAQRLASLCGGGTTVSAPLAQLCRERARVDTVLIVSDNESWCETQQGRGTETMRLWSQLAAYNPRARLICLDLQPYATSQTVAGERVMHIGGFSDAVFDLLAATANGAQDWVAQIEAIEV
ncbi:MAG TPA: VWA domain-containing protein [Tahibacter sp.]|uniref:vWA domain-containing protein n=1 Tax=Tahibacter sp. TaxID=2056211 RepID=UPI002BA722A5|nr:VWA domain-containing protein [Tahibacter sp.]HSX58860.1 VWA domain-containing protein [Tahibacter sp.]